MQTSFMIGLAVAGIAVMLVVAITTQKLEEARKLRARQVRDLTIRLRKYWSALTEMPAGCLTPDLQMILVKGISHDLKSLQGIAPDAPAIAHYSAPLKEMIPLIKNAEANTETPKFTDEKEIQLTRARLRSLHQLVMSLQEARMLNANAVQQFSSHINFLNGETMTALYMIQARAAVRELKPAVAIHHLGLCSSELAKINENGRWNAKLEELKLLQSNLEQFGAFSEEESLELADQRVALEAQKAGNAGALSEELEEMMEEEDAWKKKSNYD